ncbi:diguanylate cyclase [Paenibacillus sp. D2_2]|uniref:sensor domain-containing diguanylate cyclase n=1 Tax=Paenibacillus sp. D2_2 TaxID=3073092 RepID=UPI00281527B3|nr:diguanylate cyclase [Paenibacillus sp. D2_2]WMT40995.1 diguanylate cyclase [Paenibacillus sp. D2_2]
MSLVRKAGKNKRNKNGDVVGLKDELVLLITHGLPILFFTYMATDVLLRNKRKTENVLLCLICLCYLLLFAEEYVRNQVSIEYSRLLSSVWFSSTGILIPGLCFHFLFKLTRLEASMPRIVYPYIFYLPLLLIIVSFVTGAELISAQQFYELGMWKLPVYNTRYYLTLTIAVITEILFLIPLFIAKQRADTDEQKSIYHLLIIGIIASIILNCVLGYINYGGNMPPYPYIYNGIIWCYLLRHTMHRHDFLSYYDKRYEKLFHLNPDPIVLIDLEGKIKEANSGAINLLGAHTISSTPIFNLLSDRIKEQIHDRKVIYHYETKLLLENKQPLLQIDGDYVSVDNELHVLLILRNITMQKKYQEEIQFLAFHDPLTRIPNRRLFHKKLNEALSEAQQSNETLALLLIDLDQMKWLNDNWGHLAGDEVLIQAARIIGDKATPYGMAARMGGDEFIMYARHSPSEYQIQAIISEMQLALTQYMKKFFGETSVGMSIGVSYYPADGTDGQTLINIADKAMYQMKKSR